MTGTVYANDPSKPTLFVVNLARFVVEVAICLSAREFEGKGRRQN
jgi:patatin-like phospholipase/acyl hydrolase